MKLYKEPFVCPVNPFYSCPYYNEIEELKFGNFIENVYEEEEENDYYYDDETDFEDEFEGMR